MANNDANRDGHLLLLPAEPHVTSAVALPSAVKDLPRDERKDSDGKVLQWTATKGCHEGKGRREILSAILEGRTSIIVGPRGGEFQPATKDSAMK